jgi:hypothetical protein
MSNSGGLENPILHLLLVGSLIEPTVYSILGGYQPTATRIQPRFSAVRYFTWLKLPSCKDGCKMLRGCFHLRAFLHHCSYRIRCFWNKQNESMPMTFHSRIPSGTFINPMALCLTRIFQDGSILHANLFLLVNM